MLRRKQTESGVAAANSPPWGSPQLSPACPRSPSQSHHCTQASTLHFTYHVLNNNSFQMTGVTVFRANENLFLFSCPMRLVLALCSFLDCCLQRAHVSNFLVQIMIEAHQCWLSEDRRGWWPGITFRMRSALVLQSCACIPNTNLWVVLEA